MTYDDVDWRNLPVRVSQDPIVAISRSWRYLYGLGAKYQTLLCAVRIPQIRLPLLAVELRRFETGSLASLAIATILVETVKPVIDVVASRREPTTEHWNQSFSDQVRRTSRPVCRLPLERYPDWEF